MKLDLVIAGAVQGLGEGIQERAMRKREDALRAEERQWQLQDRQRERDWELADYDRDRAREDALISSTADAYESVYGGGNGDPERAAYVATYLMENGGFPAHIAAGLTGNFMQESGVNINTDAVGDGGNSIGAGQWNGERGEQLRAFAAERGAEWTDLDTQLDFFIWESQNTEAAAFEKIMQATTAEEAALLASEHFWRPGIPHNERRQAYARSVFEIIANPNTPESVRDELREGIGLGGDGNEPVTWQNQTWVDNGDGTSTRYGTNSATGAYEPVRGADGQPVTQTRTASADDEDGPVTWTNQYWRDNGDGTQTRMGTNSETGQAEPVLGGDGQPVTQIVTARGEDARTGVELSNALDTRLRRNELLSRTVNAEQVPDPNLVGAVKAEMIRIMRLDPSLTESEAESIVLGAAQFDEEMTEAEEGGFLGLGGTESRPTGTRTISFSYGAGSPFNDTGATAAPADPAETEELATPSRNTPAVEIPPRPEDTTDEQLVQGAKDAIARGARRSDVEQWLIAWEIDPALLDD